MIGDEEKYLESLAAGYQPVETRPLINFTGFNEEEFARLKRETESQVFLNHLKRYRFRLTLSYLVDRFRVLLLYVQEHGYLQTAKIIIIRVLGLWSLLRERK